MRYFIAILGLLILARFIACAPGVYSLDGIPADSSPPTDSRDSVASWFPATTFFNQSIRNSPVDSQSAAIIAATAARGGWGNGNILQIDFSIDVYYTDSQTLRLPFVDDGVYQPDSDLPSTVPVPATGAAGFESTTGTTCDGGDCHFLVVDTANQRLYEASGASISGSAFHSNNVVALWDFLKTYPPSLRGELCNSADVVGLPVAPLLFTAEEVAAGSIRHAIRFYLPSDRDQNKTYVRPAARGSGGVGWATTNGVPYGARFRLRADYPVTNLPAGAQVVARALQEYGMILTGTANVALSAKSDRNSTTKWSGLLGFRDLSALQVTDFDIVDAGSRIIFSSYACVRNP